MGGNLGSGRHLCHFGMAVAVGLCAFVRCVELYTWKECVTHTAMNLTPEQSGEARFGRLGALGMTGVLPGRQGPLPTHEGITLRSANCF